MRRWIVLLAIVAGCEAPADKPPAPTKWATPPLPAAWTGVPGASIGRGQAPQLVAFAGLKDLALDRPRFWQVPGDGPPRAVAIGEVGSDVRMVLYEIDADRIVWTVDTVCRDVIGVTATAVLCGTEKESSTVTVVSLATGKLTGTLTAAVASGTLEAVCDDAAREVFAYDAGSLSRIVDGKRVWSVPLESITAIAACDAASVVVTTASGVIALARDTGKETGRIDGGASAWAARDKSDRIEVATEAGIVRIARDLTGPRDVLESFPLGRLIASHGELRLVSSSPATSVLLDAKGVRAFLPFAYATAALGSSKVLTGSSMVRSIVIPPRETRALDIRRGTQRYIAVPAELRDLPAVESPLDQPIAAPIDYEPSVPVIDGEEVVVYVSNPTGDEWALLRFDARTRRWTKDETVTWSDAYPGDPFDEERVTIGKTVVFSDHGGRLPAARLANGLLVTAERNRIVGRVPAAQFVPAWSVDVHGSVIAIHAAGEGVVVELDDGDAYRIDARTGQPSALGAIGGVWAVAGDRIVASGPGGVLPVAGWPPAPVEQPTPKKKKAPSKKSAAKDDDDVPRPPRLVTPVPPPTGLAHAWQVSAFELSGALVSRNDYALSPPVTPGVRGPTAPLVLVGDNNRTALVVDPTSGAPLRRIGLPVGTDPRFVFSLIVDGKPITGVMLANPLRVVLF